MTTKLTAEQREALNACAGQPVRVADETTREVFYLLNEEAFAHLQSLQSECDEEFKDKLRMLINDGISSPEVSAEQVFANLRAELRQLSGEHA